MNLGSNTIQPIIASQEINGSQGPSEDSLYTERLRFFSPTPFILKKKVL